MIVEHKLNEFKGLLRIPSYTHNYEQVNRAGEYVQDLLQDLPIEWERKTVEGAADYFIGRTKKMDPNKPIIILSGHLDVVPEVKEPIKKDEFIYASGGYDMKGGIYSMVEVIRRIHQKNRLCNMIVALNPEEEIGNPNHGKTMSSLASEGDYVMVLEGGEELEGNNWKIVKSRKGAWVYEIDIRPHTQSTSTDLIRKAILVIEALNSAVDYESGTTVNVGIVESEPDELMDNIKTGAKNGNFIRIELTGPGGHSGNLETPETRHSTINLLVDILENILEQDQEAEFINISGGSKVNTIPEKSKGDIYSSKLTKKDIEDIVEKSKTDNEGCIMAKVSESSTPPEQVTARIRIIGEYRYRRKADDKKANEIIMRGFKKLEGNDIGVDIREIGRFPNLEENARTEQFIKLVRSKAREMGLEVIFENRAGSSDGNIFSGGNDSITVLDGFGPQGSGEHTLNERVDLGTLEISIELCERIILELLK